MKKETLLEIQKVIEKYQITIEVMESDANKSVQANERESAGGFERAVKGRLQEWITKRLIEIAWENELGKNLNRMEINSKKIPICIQSEYLKLIKDKVIYDHIKNNLKMYKYGLSVDKHVFIDRKLVMGIECKAYTENAMIKRILVDFMLLKTKYKEISCYLFQLESQLGGDYSDAQLLPFGSRPTHTLMSYFPTVNLEVVTLLKGERKVKEPIHKKEHFKELKSEQLQFAINKIVDGFKKQGLA